jgi:hypothetical protein
MRTVIWVILFILPNSLAFGENYHVAVDGSSSGTGKIDQPWSLKELLFNPDSYGIQPGDIIEVHGGVYVGTFESRLEGTETKPIVVRPYDHQKVIIKREGIVDNDYILLLKGSHNIFRDFVITSDIYNRISEFQLSPRTDVVTEIGVNLNGSNIKLINCFIHNVTGSGLNAASGAVEAEIYGNIIFHQGYNETSNDGARIFGHGHGMYLSNDQGRKLVKHNVIFKGYGHGIQFYTEGTGTSLLTGSDFVENISFNAGSLNDVGNGHYWNRNYMIGGNESTSDLIMDGNYSYLPTGLESGTGMQIGYNVINENGSIINNRIIGGGSNTFYLTNYEDITFRNNTVVGYDDIRMLNIDYPEVGGPYLYDWDFNTYYFDDPDFHQGVNSYEEWQAAHSVDAETKTYRLNELTNTVAVFPNEYEAKRASVVINNWENTPTVSVNLSAVLSIGDKFYIYDVEDLSKPILEDEYNGPINIPTNQTEQFVLQGTNVIAPPQHTGSEFGVYLVLNRRLDIMEGSNQDSNDGGSTDDEFIPPGDSDSTGDLSEGVVVSGSCGCSTRKSSGTWILLLSWVGLLVLSQTRIRS